MKKLFLIAFLAMSAILQAQVFPARVSAKTHDGDGIICQALSNDSLHHPVGPELNIRIAHINAPEVICPPCGIKHDQPGGREARAYLLSLVQSSGGVVLVDTSLGRDPFYPTRLLGRVYLQDGQDVGVLLVKNGWAWAGFDGKATKGMSKAYWKELKAAERYARDTDKGLWPLAGPRHTPWWWIKHERGLGWRMAHRGAWN